MELNLPLSVSILQWLSGQRLAERLGLSIRLWVLLHKLYGDFEQDWSDLPEVFAYTDIRDRLLSPDHPHQDPSHGQSIICPNAECICHLPLSYWLEPITDELRHSLAIPEALWEQYLTEKPFGHSHRTLRKTLPHLVESSWLKSTQPAKFMRYSLENVPQLANCSTPEALSTIQSLDVLNDISFIDPRLSVVLADLQQNINQEQRVFIHLDFIFPADTQDQVDDLQNQLNELWSQPEICPIAFIYDTRQNGEQMMITYPVCLFYARRAKYLSAYGKTPDQPLGWYNFRLDRIISKKFKTLSWSDPKIPLDLLNLKKQTKLPTSEQVQIAWDTAWGTDFYLESALMILRFEPDFAYRYIDGTERHSTFQRVDYHQISNLIRNHPERQQIQRILQQRSPEDAYYQAQVRLGDTNLIMRLRDWRPNGEVIAPLQLREQMRQEALQELDLYGR
ncbi:hypothetical protein GlitD10_0636 [Gloeomargarita lithophora Alchichica-D10]|uniref:Uncharacterized protein n=1 Tax=Gloeomargarita lithophora Alchichica-D10 TaxID=1188229 RepID=A0A1J0AAJ4_9CYAN|nr:TIGR03985 family CRISPR-associated protein [Gloeomargarita lithophora]APB32950.1 hypothetical protein GlitD10_0636 [Gloeomargarita lithophora Alchichica-D10]